MSIAADSEVMARDVHPAQIVLPDGTILQDIRCFVTDRQIIAWREIVEEAEEGRRIRTAEVALRLELLEPVQASRNSLGHSERVELRTPDGTAWLSRGRGCGCGNTVLKALSTPVPWSRR